MLAIAPDRKNIEEGAQTYLWFLESLDQVNRAIQESYDLEQMMIRVLDTMLFLFDCDRAWLVYPCDPNAASWQVPMERTKPEYPGGLAMKIEMPMDPAVAQVFTTQLAAHGPLKFGPGTGLALPSPISEQYNIKAFISTAVYPKGDKPWQFGMHQCSYDRIWAPVEERLFQEISRRLSDGLTSLLAYRNLQTSEEKYRRIVETASEGIWMIGADGTTVFVNARMASMLGYSVEEMLGRPGRDFMPQEEVPDHQKKMEGRKRGAVETYERRFLRKNGSMLWTLTSATPIFDEKNNFQGSFGMLTDITDRKRAEAELIKAKETAENAARVKSRFLDIAAHELRTPVTALSIALELAQKQIKKGQAPEVGILDRLQRQANRLGRLVVDLLDVSRLDRGVVTLHRNLINLSSLIESSVEEFSVQAPKRSIRFIRPEQSVEAPVDSLRVQQVLGNLLDNALKYTPENRPVEITAESLPDRVRISVIDHGAGISEDQQSELFKPFTRGSTDSEERASGLGLGLVVCREIVNLHGGTIGVRSKMGEGSTFYFELPRKVA